MATAAPILEFDPDPHAILNPQAARLNEPLPAHCVLCFFQEVIDQMAADGQLKKIGRLKSEIGDNPLYILEVEGQRVLVVHPGVGAPLAVGFLEEIIGMGGQYFIACGGCGVLDKEIAAGHPVILRAAVRDEGTSYHYLPPAREVEAHPLAVTALETVLRSSGVAYLVGKTWTTDALYRETPARRLTRLNEGCQVVEMEAAAFFAAARFRQVVFGQLVYGGDLVVPDGWDGRGWNKRGDDRRLLFQLAVQACMRLG